MAKELCFKKTKISTLDAVGQEEDLVVGPITQKTIWLTFTFVQDAPSVTSASRIKSNEASWFNCVNHCMFTNSFLVFASDMNFIHASW